MLVFGIVALFSLAVVSDEPEPPFLVIDPRTGSDLTKQLLFTADGQELISLGGKTIRFWDAWTGDLLRTLRPPIGKHPNGNIYTGALSADGRWLAFGGWTFGQGRKIGDIRIIDLTSEVIVGTLTGHESVVLDLSFSGDGRWLASTSADKGVRVWDLGRLDGASSEMITISESQELTGHSESVEAVSFAPNGLRLVSGARSDPTPILWQRPAVDAPFEQQTPMPKHRKGSIVDLAYSPDGRFIASGGGDYQLLLWDGQTGDFLRTLDPNMHRSVRALSFSPDGARLLAASQSGPYGTTAIYDVESDKPGRREVEFTQHDYTVTASAWHPGGNLVATAGGDHFETYLWRPETSAVVEQTILGTSRSGRRVAFVEDGSGGLKVALGDFAWHSAKTKIGPSPFHSVFDFSNFALSGDQVIEPAEGIVEALHTHQGNTLKKQKRSILLAGVLGKIKVDPREYEEINCFSFLPERADLIIGSDRSLKRYPYTEGQGFGKPIPFLGHQGEIWSLSISADARYLVTASDDHTVRLWNLKTAELLVSLFVAGYGEWISWTPTGHYHCSENGDGYLGWHLNRGGDQFADFYSAGRFRNMFYNPQLLQQTVKTADPKICLSKVTTPWETNLTKALPPRIAWDLPKGTKTEVSMGQQLIAIQAQITSPKSDLKEVRLMLNGRPVSILEGVGGRAFRFQYELQLVAGENRIHLFASNGERDEITTERLILRGKKPTLYVLSVGIGKHRIAALDHRQYPAEDAKLVTKVFNEQTNRELFGEVSAVTLIEDEASRQGLRDAVQQLQEKATAKDQVVIFLSMTGLNDDRGEFYLVPHDTDPASLYRTGMAWQAFADSLGKISAKVCLFLDTAHQGELRVPGGAELFARGVPAASELQATYDNSQALRLMVSERNGVVVLAGSTGVELGRESEQWGSGAFAKAIAEGLSGEADGNNDGTVFVEELGEFVTVRVAELTEEIGESQQPILLKPSTLSGHAIPLVVVP